MVAPAFGFSVGDFIAGTKILISVISAFKDTGGASGKYASEVSFLNSLTATLQHVEKQADGTSQDAISRDISRLLQMTQGPLDDFKKFLDKYQALEKSPTKSTLSKTSRVIGYTVKDISGKVERLRRQVEQPLQAVNSLLSLQALQSIGKLPDQPLKPEQCAQIVEAIKVADIPAELDKQIRVLQRYARAHDIQQDEQLKRIEEFRTKLDSEITSLQSAISDVAAATKEPATQKGQESQLQTVEATNTSISQLSIALESRTDKLEVAIEKQEGLILALKSFLEEKAEMQQIALATEEATDDHRDNRQSDTSWPSATLSAANLAILLLSTVVSSVAATAVITRNQKAELVLAAAKMQKKTDSSPSLSFTANSLSGASSETNNTRSCTWVSDFKRSNYPSASRRPAPLRMENPATISTPVDFGGFGGGPSRESNLDIPADRSDPNHHSHSDFDSPGIALPSTGSSPDHGGDSGGYTGGYLGGNDSNDSSDTDSD